MVDRASFRHLDGRIERHELGDLQQVGVCFVQGCGGPHRGVDGILTAVGAGKGRERQDLVFIEAGHRVYGGHGKFVARQGTGLVDAQDIQARGFVDRGEAGRKHAGPVSGPALRWRLPA